MKNTFIPDSFVPASWSDISPWCDQLLARPLNTVEVVIQWLEDYSAFNTAIFEAKAWAYINMTCNTRDEEAAKQWQLFVTEIIPPLTAASDNLMRHLAQSPAFAQLDPHVYEVMTRLVKNSLDLFREENIPVETEINSMSREFDVIAGSLDVEVNGEMMPLAKATRYLEVKDRAVRQKVWTAIINRRLREKEKLDTLFSNLIQRRTTVAQNAGFKSFTDYSFRSLGRFDYTRKDCERFHESVEKIILPAYEKMMIRRRELLGVEELAPWDLLVDLWGNQPLNPFHGADELIEKTSTLLARLHPSLGELMHQLKAAGRLDLEARLGKAPGGYSYPLPRTGLPYVFMNAAGSQTDLTVMIHEMGHAIQAWLMRDATLFTHRHLPSEIAELASMSLEMISLDHMDLFYTDEAERRRALREQLIRPLALLPWIASIDLFQHWAYDNPTHTADERRAEWEKIYQRFHGHVVKWPSTEPLQNFWQRQGHLYGAPFYYIEYGIAQLGAIAVWRNFRKDPKVGMEKYLTALAMGYSRPIPEVYAAAGIRFDFSEEYISELMQFMTDELEKLDY